MKFWNLKKAILLLHSMYMQLNAKEESCILPDTKNVDYNKQVCYSQDSGPTYELETFAGDDTLCNGIISDPEKINFIVPCIDDNGVFADCSACENDDSKEGFGQLRKVQECLATLAELYYGDNKVCTVKGDYYSSPVTYCYNDVHHVPYILCNGRMCSEVECCTDHCINEDQQGSFEPYCTFDNEWIDGQERQCELLCAGENL